MSKVAGSALLKELNSARSAATVVASGCHQLITPSPRFNRLLAPCPRRAQTAGDSRSIAGSSGWPRPAQSSGPPRWIARIKLVPKLTVRVRFPSPAQHAKSVAVEPLWRNPVLCRSVFPVHARATLGHRYPHPGTHPQASEDAQLVPSCSPAVRFSGSSKVTQGVSPQVRARCERAQLQRREETRPVIPPRAGALDAEVPVRLTIAERDIAGVSEPTSTAILSAHACR